MTSLANEEFYAADLSSEASFEEVQELESRLYSIVHYNNLSEIVPSDLPDGFKIDENKISNELIISLEDYESNCRIKTDDENQSRADDKTILNNCDDSADISCKSHNISENEVPVVPDKNCSDDRSNCLATEDSSQVCDNISSDIELIEVDSGSSVDIRLPKDSVVINLNCTEGSNYIEEIVISSSDEDFAKNEGNQASKRKKPKFKTKKSGKKLEKLCPKKWTPSMVKFYSKISRSKFNFDSSKLIKKMKESTNNKPWFISARDANHVRFHNKKVRCRRCRQYGHEVRHCTEPIKPITCYMCGEPGHRENRCPQKKCLTCGRPNPVFVPMCSSCSKSIWRGDLYCFLCYSKYHNTDLCPEIWRAFHMTTTAEALIVPSQQTLKKICCNCGKRGHLDFECNKLLKSNYVIDNPIVKNYVGVAQVFALDKDNLTLVIRWDSRNGSSLTSENGYGFLQHLSDTTGARLELHSVNFSESLKVTGLEEQCRSVVNSICAFLNEKVQDNETSFHKHKTKSSPKKRRTI